MEPNKVTLSLEPLKTIVMKNATKVNEAYLQDYKFLNHPITSLFDGFVMVHVFEHIDNKKQGLFFIIKEKSFVLSKPDLFQLLKVGTSIGHTIVITTSLSTQSATLRTSFLKHSLHIGEILSIDEVLIPKLRSHYVPRYQVLTKEEAKKYRKDAYLEGIQIPEMIYARDAIARYMGFYPGTMVMNMDKNLPRMVV